MRSLPSLLFLCSLLLVTLAGTVIEQAESLEETFDFSTNPERNPGTDSEVDGEPGLEQELQTRAGGSDDEVDDDMDYEDDFDDFEDESDGAAHGGADALSHKDDDDDGDEDGDGASLVDPAVLAAMRSENVRVHSGRSPGRGQSNSDNDGDEASDRARPARPFTARLNFGQARQSAREKATKKSERRFQELKKLIELNVIDGNLYEQAPMSEYELYMRNYGSSNAVQTGVQCSEQT